MLTVRCDGSTPLLHVKMPAVICKDINGHASSYALRCCICPTGCWPAGKGSKWWPVPAIKQKLGLTPPPKVAQRYFPQCLTCCQKQSAAVKANKRTLVAHNGGARPWYYAGNRLATACCNYSYFLHVINLVLVTFSM